MPAPRLGEDGAGRYLALRYRHNRDAERLILGMEGSNDLSEGSWVTVVPDETVDVGVDETTGDPIREMRVRIGAEQRKFVRMVVREGTK